MFPRMLIERSRLIRHGVSTGQFRKGSALSLIPIRDARGLTRPTDKCYDCKQQFDGEARPRVIYFGTSRRQIVCPYVRIATEDSEVTSDVTVLHRRVGEIRRFGLSLFAGSNCILSLSFTRRLPSNFSVVCQYRVASLFLYI